MNQNNFNNIDNENDKEKIEVASIESLYDKNNISLSITIKSNEKIDFLKKLDNIDTAIKDIPNNVNIINSIQHTLGIIKNEMINNNQIENITQKINSFIEDNKDNLFSLVTNNNEKITNQIFDKFNTIDNFINKDFNDKIKQSLNVIKDDLEKKENSINTKFEQIDSVIGKINYQTDNKISQLKSDIEILINGLNDKEKEDLKKKVSELEYLRDKSTEYETKITSLEQDIIKNKDNLSKLNSDIHDEREKVSQKDNELSQKVNQICAIRDLITFEVEFYNRFKDVKSNTFNDTSENYFKFDNSKDDLYNGIILKSFTSSEKLLFISNFVRRIKNIKAKNKEELTEKEKLFWNWLSQSYEISIPEISSRFDYKDHEHIDDIKKTNFSKIIKVFTPKFDKDKALVEGGN